MLEILDYYEFEDEEVRLLFLPLVECKMSQLFLDPDELSHIFYLNYYGLPTNEYLKYKNKTDENFWVKHLPQKLTKFPFIRFKIKQCQFQ